MLGSLAPARRRLVLGAAGLLVVALVVTVVLVVRGREPAATPSNQDDAGPVLLVPGFGGSTDALRTLGRALSQAGRQVVVVPPVDDGRGDLAEQAAVLGDVVDATLADPASTAGTVDLVGYSAGGVVVRWYVDQLGGADRVRRVLTLASPHHGTDLAALAGTAGSACSEACQQLDPDSDLLARLNAGDETPPGPTWVALWTADDRTVVPPSSGSLDGADVDLEVQSVCPGLEVPHGEVPSNPAVVALVVDLLAPGPPETPTTCPT